MARLPRLYAPGIVQRIALKAAPGRLLAEGADDYRLLGDVLAEASGICGLAIHAYLLMPTDILLLATPAAASSIARTVQAIGRRYVPHANRKADRQGALWDRRYRSTLIEAERYLLDCTRHIEATPVVEKRVQAQDEWPWSSYRHHAGLVQDPLVTDHAVYWTLGNTPFERQAAFKALAESAIDAELATAIAHATDRGWALGSADFVRDLEVSATRRLMPAQRGRPRNAPA